MSDPIPAGRLVDHALTRRFFAVAALICAVNAVAMALEPWPIGPGARVALVSLHALAAAVCAWGWSGRGPLQPRTMLWLAVGGVLLLCAAFAALVGHGAFTLRLGFVGVLLGVITVLLGVRAAVSVGAVSAGAVLGMGWAESAGWLHGAQAAAAAPLAHALVTQVLIIVAGLGAGIVMLQLIGAASSAERELSQRLSGVLTLAADHYWELDRELRLLRFECTARGEPRFEQARGHRLWDVAEVFEFSADAAATLKRQLLAHQPFRKLLARLPSGVPCSHLRFSGEPRVDADGRFIGYWGVTEDVSAEVQAEQARQVSDHRYGELFRQAPSAMVLHRNGHATDVNEAATQVLSMQREQLIGADLRQLAFDEVSRQLIDERCAALEDASVGSTLPWAELRLTDRQGDALHLRTRCMRVLADDGPATLTMLVDDTAAKRAEAALRRSESTLSTVFASSPECITMAEWDSGRYVMVNEAWCTLFGFSRDEVIGRNSAELGLWADEQQRTRLLEALAGNDRVSGLRLLRRTRSGEMRVMLVSVGRCRIDGADYIVVNSRDTTEDDRRRQEHGAILAHAPIGVAFARERRFASANAAFERMFGLAEGALASQPDDVLWRDGEAAAAIEAEVAAALGQGGATVFERMLQRADGVPFWCRMRVQALEAGAALQPGVIWIAEDLSERHRTDEALAAARDAAEAASRAKSAFLANTSHEIRTPLNGLVGLARLASDPSLDPARRNTYLGHIQDTARNLAGLIADILDLSRIEAGRLSLQVAPFAPRELLRAVVAGYQSLADDKGLRLDLVVDERVPATLLGDALRVRQIIGNLLSNAIKFTERGFVRLEATPAGEPGKAGIRLTVQDSGIGIDTAIQARLFEPFSQADDSTTRRFGGSGLGLSICRDLAEMMGGTVGVHSQPGTGSRFWVELPLPATAQAVAPPAAALGADALHRLRGARVLVVEDNEVNLLIASALLAQWQVEPTEARDGAEAIAAVDRAAAQGRPFDAVLMDLQMPGVDGTAATRRIRERFTAAELPIIALTAAALTGERERALEAGMNDFLTKPIEPSHLQRVLTAHLSGHRS